MADKADKNNTPSETPTESSNGVKKRRLRSSSETVRERTEKLQQEASAPSKPKPHKAFATGFAWPLRKLGQLLAPLGRFRIVRFLGRILLPRYFRNSWRELRLVTWPDRMTTLRLTWAVIVFSVIFGLIVAGVDFVLDKLFKELIIK